MAHKSFRFFVLTFLIALSFLVLAHLPAEAHSVGQPPFFEINSKFAGFYHVPQSSQFFTVPQDQSPDDHYLVRQPLHFIIDTLILGVPQDIVNKSTFIWNFGDSRQGTGTDNTYTYSHSGSYILTISASYASEQPQLIESVLLQILPNPDYQLPHPVIFLNHLKTPLSEGTQVPFSPNTSVSFDSSQSTGTGPLRYLWDFGDETTATSATTSHQYLQDKTHTLGQVLFPLLRVSDANGFYTDTFFELDNNTQLVPITPKTPPTSSPTVRSPYSAISRPTNPLSLTVSRLYGDVMQTQSWKSPLFIAIAALLFILGSLHALTPGHGKSIMAAYLLGEKGNKFIDVIILAFTITVTHTAVIYLLGLILFLLNQTANFSAVLPYFDRFGLILVILLGALLIIRGLKALGHSTSQTHEHFHVHPDEQSVDSTHPHRHLPLLLAGFSGGITPCTDAFALFIFFVSKREFTHGFIAIIIFSLGLATAIVALGLFLVIGKHRLTLEERFSRFAETYAPIIAGSVLLALSLHTLI